MLISPTDQGGKESFIVIEWSISIRYIYCMVDRVRYMIHIIHIT